MSLFKSALTQLGKSVLIPLELSAGMSVVDAAIQKKIYVSGTAALIISNEEMEDIMKIVKWLEESGLLIKGISGTVKNKTIEQKGGFFSMLLGTLVVSILAARRSNNSRWKFLMLSHPLTKFEIQKYYQSEHKFNDAYSRNNLSEIEDGAYIKNRDEHESKGTHWIALYVNVENVIYYDSLTYSKRN